MDVTPWLRSSLAVLVTLALAACGSGGAPSQAGDRPTLPFPFDGTWSSSDSRPHASAAELPGCGNATFQSLPSDSERYTRASKKVAGTTVDVDVYDLSYSANRLARALRSYRQLTERCRQDSGDDTEQVSGLADPDVVVTHSTFYPLTQGSTPAGAGQMWVIMEPLPQGLRILATTHGDRAFIHWLTARQ